MEMDLKLKIEIEAEFPDELSAKAAAEGLAHESKIEGRSSAKVSLENKKLTIVITAQDVVSLRASANSYLRTLQAIDGIEIDD